jgi:uncharacterized repeat protein (TIGR03803 family)
MLFGTTLSGGTDGNGTVFEVNPATKTLTTIYAFPTVSCPPNNCYPDGQGPYAGLIVDAKGSLYGTTSAGGATGSGAIFEVTPGKKGTWTESVLYSFLGGQNNWFDGYDAVSPLVFDKAGLLYGTTEFGGDGYGPQGTVFQFNPSTKSLTTLYSFDGIPPQGCPPNCETYYANGDQPVGALSIDSKTGALYGTTQGGGSITDDNCFNDFDSGCGTVFVLTP